MVNKDDFLLRIPLATPARLVVINYEIIEAFLEEALAEYETDTQLFITYVDKAKNGLVQLIKGLNFDITVAQDLYQIYTYIEKLLNTAFFSRNRDAAAEALSLVQMLLAAWREVADHESDETPQVMEGTPQVYAGLTYARDGLSEYVVQDDKRGFKA